MTLIWHDWFATSNQGVASQRLMLDQVDFFRGNALGSFRDILLGVTKDPAMLVWLNGNQNIRQRPNENYSRELMELFTLGANRGAYTETDVREQARALTGWRGNVVNRQSTGFTYNAARHDTRQQDDLRQDRQLRLGGLVPALPRPPAAPVVLRREDVELLHPDEDRQRDVEGAAGALRERAMVRPVVEAILLHPQFYEGPRMAKPPVVFNAGLLRMRGRYVDTSTWWTLGQQAGQQLFYPPDVGGWDDTRWLDTVDVPRALVHRRARAGRRRDAGRQPERSREARRRARSSSGARRRSRPTTQGLLKAFAAAQLKRKIDAGNVETALRRLIASSPDLQTGDELLRLQPLRELPPRGGGGRRPAGDRAGHAAAGGHGHVAAHVPLALGRAGARGLRRQRAQRAPRSTTGSPPPRRTRPRTRRCSSRSS